MNFRYWGLRVCLLFSVGAVGIGLWTLQFEAVEAADSGPGSLEDSFMMQARPFLQQNCVACHNGDVPTSGIRLDQLDGKLDERHLRLWSVVRRRIVDESMPPKGMPQPTDKDRAGMADWITRALDVARSRPTPRNGGVRRLTVAQYRNTLRELLQLEDNLTDILPPDAVSKDGFVNNADTLELSPLLMEAYFKLADEALSRALVNPDARPSIQKFRVNLGDGINKQPIADELILGANSMLLEKEHYTVEQLEAEKPFPLEPFWMKTNYRFIEGYKGNGTVRGWREFNSIYHAVFACMRGGKGYPKGTPYAAVTDGLLLRPAIPADEIFQSDGTYGHKANFKISVRELPNYGRFRVTVTAAKYDDGLLLDAGVGAREPTDATITVDASTGRRQSVEIPEAGIYQVDVYENAIANPPAPDASGLNHQLAGAWDFEETAGARFEAEATRAATPFGQSIVLDGTGDAVVVTRDALPEPRAIDVGDGDFTVAAWIEPRRTRNQSVVVVGSYDGLPGWRLDMATNRGVLRFITVGPGGEEFSVVSSSPGALRAKAWQHVAAVVDGSGQGPEREARLYVNGYLVAKGQIDRANLNSPKADLHFGRLSYAQHYQGKIDSVRLYKRALGEAELQALVEPGRQFAQAPPLSLQDVTITLGDRPFATELKQPAFLAVRLPEGLLDVRAQYEGLRGLDRITVTRVPDGDAIATAFEAFEQRLPRVGVHLGFRRDCGSTLPMVGEPQTVASTELREYKFEAAIRDYPSPDVEDDNVNYLAGVREIGVRSEYTDGRDMPRLLVKSVEFEGPLYETWPPASHRSVFVESDQRHDGEAYAREILTQFAAKAYRRPARPGELAALMRVYSEAIAAGSSFQDSVKDAVTVVLTSPQFLFLVESSETPEAELIDEYELASKLSYFLWNTPPDLRTLQLAERGALRASLDAEVSRLIDDERFARFAHEFTSQWLNLEKFDVVESDREKFPLLTRDVRHELRREPVEYMTYLIRENKPVQDLVSADYILANEVTASYYGLGHKTESGFSFVPVRHEREELGGILSQAALMAGLSDGRESNPVKRGAWVARKIVAEPPDDPPPNVPELAEDTKHLSLRKRLEMHRSQPGCMQCHTKIDPWGVALEEFDAGGRLKAEAADARSELPDGTVVDGISGLKRYLAEDRIDQVAYSVLLHLATYANGRSLTYNQQNALRAEATRLTAENYGMQDIVRYVAQSDLFLQK